LKVAYLGPTGTFTEEALLDAAAGAELELSPRATIFEAVNAVERGEAGRGFVPFENSVEGAVRSTLDALAFDTEHVRIAGEHDHPIRHNLIAAEELELERIEVVVSHPQANAQCARFIREQLPEAEVRAIASTSDAVRQVAEAGRPWAALGSAAAAAAYGCVILRGGVEDVAENVTRFVWLARGEDLAGAKVGSEGTWRTSLVFSELGDDRPGALVDALLEFSSRDVNLTRIESRPLRRGLGRYLFFVDLEGRLADGSVAQAIDGLREKADVVRILGSYAVGGAPPL
jgi:prephenate dehydratase